MLINSAKSSYSLLLQVFFQFCGARSFTENIIFLFQMVEDPLQLLRIKCVADEQGDGVLGNFINRSG